MNSRAQKQHPAARKDQADGQGEGRSDPFEATTPQPKDIPVKQVPASPDDEKEERSKRADIGEAEEQEGVAEGTKKGAAHQDPPPTRPGQMGGQGMGQGRGMNAGEVHGK